MNYLKYTITLTPDNQEFREILIATLSEAGFESFVENEQSIEAFIKADSHSSEIIDQINFETLFQFNWVIEKVLDQNWNEEWEKNYFKPLIIADICVVRAPFHNDYPHKEIEIVIEPNMAFGTGNHETTTMMMEFILETNLSGKNVLDMGCGTGILAILASKRGAEKITAIDIDKWSFEGTTENAQLNNAKNIYSILGDANSIPNDKYDLILANIHKNVIMSDLPVYCNALTPDGILIVSGFYESDLKDVIQVARKFKLHFDVLKTKNNWCSARFSN